MAIYINGITVEMFRNATLEAVEDLMAEGQMIDVPEPHGRLIDADALIQIMKYTTTDNEIGVFPIRIGFDAIKGVIDEAPTVIERSDK